eukprot:2467995-Prymnesium_polylepis.3
MRREATQEHTKIRIGWAGKAAVVGKVGVYLRDFMKSGLKFRSAAQPSGGGCQRIGLPKPRIFFFAPHFHAKRV